MIRARSSELTSLREYILDDRIRVEQYRHLQDAMGQTEFHTPEDVLLGHTPSWKVIS